MAATDKVEKLEGTVESVVYTNEENFYAVLEIFTAEKLLVTAVGTVPHPAEGERMILYGSWVKHADYGMQFSFRSFEKELPKDEEAILRYLSSHTVRGIGPATGKRIVEKFGTGAFEVIENHPEWLADIPGISKNRAAEIHKSFMEQSGVRMLVMLCRDFLPYGVLSRAFDRWGISAAEKIKEDPYLLCEIPGAGFDKVDALAASLGVGMESDSRILGGVRYLLEYNAAFNGHTCLPANKLADLTSSHLSLPRERVEEAMALLLDGGLLLSVKSEGETYVGLTRYMGAEKYIAGKLIQLEKSCPAFQVGDVDTMVERLEKQYGITYADEQYLAIRSAMERGVLLVTGGPGTGKTTVIRALLHLFESMGMKVALAAPTGRAAKRMAETTGCEAKTIHRMLEMERSESDTARYNRNASNPLDEKVVIVDEASMLDVTLLEALLRALRRGSRLLLIGDADQLPSVGAGNVLADLIGSGTFATVRLTRIYRQEDESLIVSNAHRINRGEMPLLDRKDRDFFYLPCSEEELPDLVADLIGRRLPKAYGKEFAQGIQVITPSRKGRAGTESLNALLQARLNPPAKSKKEKKLRGVPFREGDRVMQIRNNYEIQWMRYGTDGTGVFNGDVGVIEEISAAEDRVSIRFDDDRVAEYEGAMGDEIEHAYAITVHKSQGSEYTCVILPLGFCPPMLMTRNLLYTAVTRAKKMVILAGRLDMIRGMVENDRQVLRYTALPTYLERNGRE